MPVIIRNTLAGRRATLISQTDLDEMLDAGTAKACPPHALYEEVTKEEQSQGYMTRNLEALPVIKPIAKKPGPKPKGKPVVDDEGDDE